MCRWRTKGRKSSGQFIPCLIPIWNQFILSSVRVIAKRTLREFWETAPKNSDAQGPLEAWYFETLKATRTTPQELKAQFRSASILKNKKDYDRALAEIERLWGAEEGTEAGDKLDILLVLVEDYEEKHHQISPPSPIEAIKFRMEQMNLTRKDLEPYIGNRGRVSEILNQRRELSLNMIRNLHSNLR